MVSLPQNALFLVLKEQEAPNGFQKLANIANLLKRAIGTNASSPQLKQAPANQVLKKIR
jgi:hypothetical protein